MTRRTTAKSNGIRTGSSQRAAVRAPEKRDAGRTRTESAPVRRARVPADLVIVNIGQLLPMTAGRAFEVISGGAVAIRQGRILRVGPEAQVVPRYTPTKKLDARGKVVTPGLVDAHTHVVFAGSREKEFEERVKGATYQEIAARGGGIASSVAAVRRRTVQELVRESMPRVKRMFEHGTTTAEAKSGYGLSLDDEVKILEAIRIASGGGPVDLVPTFLGAHAIPREFAEQRDEYVKLVTRQMIPAVVHGKLAEFCDVFCERGAFTREESRSILLAARSAGLKLKIHAEEFSDTGGAMLAAELGAVSADHLMAVSDIAIDALRRAGVVAVLLPCATFFLGLKDYAPARKMIDRGLVVALGTDCNPGSSMTESMQMAMSIACAHMRMTPAEALLAATLNAARAIGRESTVGSLEPEKLAHLVIWDVQDYRQIPYHFGVNLAWRVLK
ncbi:MAG: imidazolonepropionase [Planctomycetota bacterium]|nr:imidazolonepropionase [Planctomycetota bacterium]